MQSIRFPIFKTTAICCAAIFTGHSKAATLLVDFGLSTSPIATGYAGFTFGNATAPGSRTFLAGTAGYDASMDTGAGITVTLQNGQNPGGTLRMLDRNTPDSLLREFAGIDGINGNNQVVFAGLAAGDYQFKVYLTDPSNQRGVVDVQLSTNGGSNFTNLNDNAAYGAPGNTLLVDFAADGTNSVMINFWTGGNQFGTVGQTSDNVSTNRIFTLNGFDLVKVPEPSVALLGGLGLLLLRRRRN